MSHGVRIFRVDNPHTKPVNFWAWLLGEIRKTDPDVLFLAEAFTKPAMMQALGKAGFQQGYTYFTWRNEKWEIEEYMTELTTETDSFFRPSFWVNTPDILPSFLQWGGKPAFTIRAVLAATLSPLMGVYSGYELFENAALGQGREEYLDSEKFQYRPRDWQAAEESGENLNLLLGRLNQIRKEHPALQQLRDLHFHHAPHDKAIVYSKRSGRRHGDHRGQPRPAQRGGDRDLLRHGGPRADRPRRLPGARRDHRPDLALGSARLRPAHPRRPGPRPHPDPLRLPELGRSRRRRRPTDRARGAGRIEVAPDTQVADAGAGVHLTAPAGSPARAARVELASLTPLPWLTEMSEFFAASAAPAVRLEIAEVAYAVEDAATGARTRT